MTDSEKENECVVLKILQKNFMSLRFVHHIDL